MDTVIEVSLSLGIGSLLRLPVLIFDVYLIKTVLVFTTNIETTEVNLTFSDSKFFCLLKCVECNRLSSLQLETLRLCTIYNPFC